ncbi:hypothetical protein PMKS-000254 [Pichia membranifaciens]|uniref:Uncharacterized protein n=1 Tax=Pichia membranifaciens TaxID=4926 RepID=A0A1Q2YBD2_9ASCO|nr:hypothetical protein PMKS-000254 [Pichia membranifaciens]
MPPKKGQFPERPPTLAEALYQGKEMGTKPDNYEQILKDLNLDALKKPEKKDPENKTETTKVVTSTKPKQAKKETISKPVKQVDAHIDAPIPAEAPPSINSTYILPTECEAVTNLQMDYLLHRKSAFIRSIISSRVFSSLGFGIFTMIAYYKVGDYFTEYTFKKGTWDGVKSLYANGYFMDDAITMLFMIAMIVATFFTFLKFLSNPLQQEADTVPKNFEKYFGIDLNKYAVLSNVEKNYNKLNKADKDLVKHMKDNTFCIVYREVPVAFLACKQTKSSSDDKVDVEITAYAVRKVYVKAELFKDLISMVFKKFITNEKINVNQISIDVYNFENFDINILKRAGFYRQKRHSLGFLLTSVLGMTKDTYVFESESIEF